MDSFSPASLYSLCSAMIQHAASSTAEAQSILQSAPQSNQVASQIAALSASFHAASVQVTHLEHALQHAAAISVPMQSLLTENLTSCNSLAARLHKQMMRLHRENLKHVDARFVAAHLAALTAYQGLFQHLSQTLSIPQRDAQDSDLAGFSAQQLIQQAASASQAASQTTGILLDDKAAQGCCKPSTCSNLPHRPKNRDVPQDEPPPYAPTDPWSSDSHQVPTPPQTEAGPSSGFSLGRTLKAFEHSLMPKPDPFVNALCQAVTSGDIQQVTGLLSQGINIDGRGEGGKTPLQCAIVANQQHAADVLLSAGANYTSAGGWGGHGMPPMFQAAAAGRVGIAKLIMARGGVQATEKSIAGQPYLVDVVGSNNLDGVRFLLDHGASPNSSSISGRRVLVQAVRQSNPALVDLLIEYGAEVNTPDMTGSSILAVAADKEDLHMVRTLLDNGADVDGTTVCGVSVLVDAIARRRLDLARVLLDYGADGNMDDVLGRPIILTVVKNPGIRPGDKVDLVRRLLEKGASPNVKDTAWGTPALCFALESGTPDLVRLLLEHGADTDVVTSAGEPPLMCAVDKGKMAEARMLLEHGADADGANRQGKTPLMQAVVRQDVQLIKLLLEHGANVQAAGAVGMASFAGALRRPDILHLLGVGPGGTSAGAPPDYQT
ncbi:hypothetical protein J3458_009526 [Metarhizium acridum]|uniref:Ankyrin repeat protein n=1 Tax=Metarhizium acridum (strain CQMa 102) TaxID=655827 RepID=E9EC74_METAQ|nr:ankyrin repeat protein [Metarhizium acridum CQMa 102]EFY86458.1 ankyrin repeat protein [Metarhizium acridum CQMa 102]KAG8415703.1 hypothetical protein J3458_009526 [Metarhizium acridum]